MKDGVSTTKLAFEQLTDCLDATLIAEWTKQERVAMEKRGDDLNIFTVSSDKCKTFHYSACSVLMCLSTYSGGNTVEVVGNRSPAGQPIGFGFRPYRGSRY